MNGEHPKSEAVPDENVCPASGTPARAGYRGQTVDCPECGKSVGLGGDIHELRGIIPRHLRPESERSPALLTSNPVDTAMIAELKRLSAQHRGYLGDQLGNAALRMQGLIEEIERLTRERDEAREAYTDENLQKHGLIGKYGRLTRELASERNLVERLRRDLLDPPPDVQEVVLRKYGYLGSAVETRKNPSPFAALKAQVQADHAYAWTWHCNLAMPLFDAGSDIDTANEGAACIMQMLFDVDTKSFPEWASRRRPDPNDLIS